MYKRLFLYQHVVEPTRFRPGEASSLLDLILTNKEMIIKSVEPLRTKKTFIRKKLGHTMVLAIKASPVTL